MDAKLSWSGLPSTHIPCYWYLFAGTNRSQKLSPVRICHKKLFPVTILTLKVIPRSSEIQLPLPNSHGIFFAPLPRAITFVDAKLSGSRFQSPHIPRHWYLFAGTNRPQKLSPVRICHKKLYHVCILSLKVIFRSYETQFPLPNRHGR